MKIVITRIAKQKDRILTLEIVPMRRKKRRNSLARPSWLPDWLPLPRSMQHIPSTAAWSSITNEWKWSRKAKCHPRKPADEESKAMSSMLLASASLLWESTALLGSGNTSTRSAKSAPPFQKIAVKNGTNDIVAPRARVHLPGPRAKHTVSRMRSRSTQMSLLVRDRWFMNSRAMLDFDFSCVEILRSCLCLATAPHLIFYPMLNEILDSHFFRAMTSFRN